MLVRQGSGHVQLERDESLSRKLKLLFNLQYWMNLPGKTRSRRPPLPDRCSEVTERRALRNVVCDEINETDQHGRTQELLWWSSGLLKEENVDKTHEISLYPPKQYSFYRRLLYIKRNILISQFKRPNSAKLSLRNSRHSVFKNAWAISCHARLPRKEVLWISKIWLWLLYFLINVLKWPRQ